MIRIQKLSRPTKRSGICLEPGAATMMRGMRVINQNKFQVYVDKFTPPSQLKKNADKKKAK